MFEVEGEKAERARVLDWQETGGGRGRGGEGREGRGVRRSRWPSNCPARMPGPGPVFGFWLESALLLPPLLLLFASSRLTFARWLGQRMEH